MKIKLPVLAALFMLLAAPASRADFFALDIDAQAGYLRLERIEHPDSFEPATLAGGSVGVRGKLEILFISLLVDYQHLFNNADFLHAGLGADFSLPLGVVEPYIKGSVGLLMLAGKGGAFSPSAQNSLEAVAGLGVRVGAGMDIPLGDWFALGVGADFGYHYITGKSGWDLSVVGYLGLRI